MEGLRPKLVPKVNFPDSMGPEQDEDSGEEEGEATEGVRPKGEEGLEGPFLESP